MFGFLKTLFEKKNPKAQPRDEKETESLIQAYDEFGRQIFMSRSQWRDSVLPGNLKSQWDDPDALYQTIIAAINDGFEADIFEATRRLFEIDPERERAATIWGIVLMRAGRLDEAEQVFLDFTDEFGEQGIILTNLAKVHFERKDMAKAQETLWHALELDPNQDNGMGWYVQMQLEQGGQEAYLSALERIAAIPTSWRAPLWLAREAISTGDLDGALQLYNRSLERTGRPVPADALMQISADLGRAGELKMISEIVEPYYDASYHGLQVGNNLIKAHFDSGEFAHASQLVEQLYALKRPDWQDTLSYWDTEIAKAKLAVPTLDALSVSMLQSEGPVWIKRNSGSEEILPKTKASGPKICFLGSSVTDANAKNEVEAQLADTRGRLARAVPLFLAEQLHFKTDAVAQTLVPWIEQGGFALVGYEWGDENAAQYASTSEYVITTHLICGDKTWDIEARIVRVADHTCLGTFKVSFDVAKPELAIQALTNDIFSLLEDQVGLKRCDSPIFYDVPAGALFPYYLLRLEQLLAVRCGNKEGVRADFLNGSRNIVDGNIELCMRNPQNVTTRILLAETLLSMKAVQPEILEEFQDKIGALQARHPLPSPAHGVVQSIFDGAFAA